MDIPLIVAVLTFLAITLASTAFFFYFTSREAVQTWRRRADGTMESGGGPASLIDQLLEQFQILLEWFGKWNQSSNIEEVRATRRRLITAGYRSGKAAVFCVGAKLLLAITLVCLLTLIPSKLLGFPTASKLTFFYVLAAACGYYAPVLWLRRAIVQRKDALQRAIPDALDLMVVCVEAGLGLDQAIGRVGEEIKRTHAELSD